MFLAGVLIVLGLMTRFIFISTPAQVVFDEVHFGKFVSSYFSGNYYFDIHPPLGKMIIAAGAWFGGYGDYVAQNGVFSFKDIGGDYGSAPYLWFRFLPALAGSLIPLVVFLFMFEFGAGKLASFLTGLLLIFENSLLVESRLILMDAFLILFGFLGLYFFFKARNDDYPFPLIALSGLLLALSVSIKWTGLGFWGACGLIFAYDLIYPTALKLRGISPAESIKDFVSLRWRYFINGLIFLVIIPLLAYFAVFQIHFALLPNCPAKGEGNGCDFMSKEFRDNQLNPWQEFSELNQKMWSYNRGISASHEYGSKALGWPLMVRSVYYWVNDSGARIYMIGNPVNWFLGLFGILGIWFVPLSREKKIIIGLLYLANFLPFILVERVLFLYHYLFALIISLVAFSFVFSAIGGSAPGGDEVVKSFSSRSKVFVVSCLLSVVSSAFLFFAPLSYGLPLTDQEFRERQWSSLWFSGNSQLKEVCLEKGCSLLKWLVY